MFTNSIVLHESTSGALQVRKREREKEETRRKEKEVQRERETERERGSLAFDLVGNRMPVCV